MSDEGPDLQTQVSALQSQVSALEQKVSALQEQLAKQQEDDDIPFPVEGSGP